jgi:hypothetical protein
VPRAPVICFLPLRFFPGLVWTQIPTKRRYAKILNTNMFNTRVFSIKFLYIFIISSLFPYFNLFVSIFIQSYANNNLHVFRGGFRGGVRGVRPPPPPNHILFVLLLCINHNCYLYMPSWGPDLVNKLISISISILIFING